MEDKLFDKIRESEELYGQVDMPRSALDKFRAYEVRKMQPNNSYYKRLLIGLFTAFLLTNGLWYINNNKKPLNTSTSINSINTIRDTIYITKEVFKSENSLELALVENEKLEARLIEQEQSFKQHRISFLGEINQLQSRIVDIQRVSENFKISDSGHVRDSRVIQHDNNSLFLGFLERSEVNPLSLLETLDISLLRKANRKINFRYDPIIIKLNQKQSFTELVRPKSFSIYLNGGFAQQNGNRYSALSGSEVGIGITSIMSNHWRYNLNLNVSKLNSELENDDSLPNIQSPDAPAGYELEEVYLYQNNFSGAFGIDYLFDGYKFIRPYAGVYYQYRSSNFRGSVFKFESDTSDELKIAVPNITQFSVNEIGFRGGLDFNLWNSVDAFFGVNYRHNFSTIENSFFSVNTGIYYHF